MTPALKRRIQIVLAIAIAVAAIRTGYILEKRHSSKAPAAELKMAAPPLDADYYVTPKKLHAYDLKSARELMQQPVWIKEGYRYSFFPYNPGTHRVDFDHEVGQLLPLQKLEIKDVLLVPAPESARERLPGGAVLRGQKQVVARFDQGGGHFVVPVGNELNGDYKIYADEMFFIQDPRQLYQHWPADIWEAVDKHQVKPGMNELQADFAIGMGTPQPSTEEGLKTVNYPNGGKPLRITYRDGKAVDIKAAAG
jgi:hypothetical protein